MSESVSWSPWWILRKRFDLSKFKSEWNAAIFPETWGSDLSPGEERLVLTFMMGTEIPVPVPPSFIRMTFRKSGIKIKGKPKKKWRVTARKNILSINSWVQFWALCLRMHSCFGTVSNRNVFTNQWIFRERRRLIQRAGSQYGLHSGITGEV